MHLGINRNVIEERRQERRDRDVPVLDAGKFGHHEGGGSHHRGQQTAAGGGRYLHRAGERAVIAHALHHRDCDGTGGHHVRGWAAGNHAVQAGRYDGDLGDAADLASIDRRRQIEEELAALRRM